MFTNAELFWYSFTLILILIIITIIAKHDNPQEGMKSINNIKNLGEKVITGIKNTSSVVANGVSKLIQPVKARVWQDPGATSLMDPSNIGASYPTDQQDSSMDQHSDTDKSSVDMELSCSGEETRNDYVGSRECRGAYYGFAGCGKASRVPNAELAFDAIGELTINRLDPNELNTITDCNGDTHTNVYSYTEPTGCPYNKE